MAAKNDDLLSKSDLDSILEVNKKAIEVQIEVASQNEKVIEALEEVNEKEDSIKKDIEYLVKDVDTIQDNIKESKKEIMDKIDSLKKAIDELDRTQFKIHAVLTTGAIAVILQIIQIVLNWKK